MESIIAEMLVDEGVRLAGERRLVLERRAREEGLELAPQLLAQLQELSSAAGVIAGLTRNPSRRVDPGSSPG
jgi:(2R)-3-sulfolactate dehydrogenase (NADP+)